MSYSSKMAFFPRKIRKKVRSGPLCCRQSWGNLHSALVLCYMDLFQVSRLNIRILEIENIKQAATSQVPEEEVSDAFHAC